MNLAQRLELALPRFPLALRVFYHAEIEAGNELRDVELGGGPDEGKAAIVLYKEFLTKPKGLKYRALRDRDPMTFEYHSEDDCFSVLWVKFKPMKFEKITGPKNPTADHIKVMKKRAKEEEALAKKRAKLAAKEEAKAAKAREKAIKQGRQKSMAERAREEMSDLRELEALAQREARAHRERVPTQDLGEDARKFLESMVITYDKWREGEGYDLEKLRRLTGKDLEAVEAILIDHSPRDWRDVEALAQIKSDRAKQVVEQSLNSRDQYIRQEAMKYADKKLKKTDRQRLLIHSLEHDEIYTGLSQAIDEAAEFHPPKVIDTLFRCTLDRDGASACHLAALLYFLHGKAKSRFDWDHRPFFLRFNTSDRAERKAAFLELCEKVGVDAKKYTR